MILFTLMLTCLIIPLAGLAIDLTMLYIVQAKLSGAVDGAALGAGRLLGTQANIEEIALEFLRANFPQNPKYWGSTLSDPAAGEIHYWHPSLNTHEIDITGHASVPLLFLQIFQGTPAVVTASAIATRRDTRVVVVLDRSYSMYSYTDPTTHNTVFSEAISGAKTFTDMFTAGTDELGLIFFGSSAIVAYPNYTTRPYDGTPTTNTGGPDTGFLTANSTPKTPAQGPMMDMLNAVKAGNVAEYTGMAEGLSMAYIELMRGHNRAVAANGSDDRLNAIVLMTDGVPTTISVYINNRASPASTYNSLKTQKLVPPTSSATLSPCANNPATATVSTQMIGSMGIPPLGAGTLVGFFQLAWNNTGTTLNWVKQNVTPNDSSTISPNTPTTGCATLPTHVNYQGSTQYSDLRVIPAFDYWGNSTTGGGYTNSDIVQNGHAASPPSVYNGTTYDATQIGRTNSTSTAAQTLDAYHMQLAIWQAVDAAGLRIRTVADPKIAIYTIGYEGTDGVDQGLLKRVANDPRSSSYVVPPAQEQGMYVSAGNAAELHSAFVRVASELLRLAK
ncbi:MAG: pilus assembly protein TadG-related protein [Bryobacteraceae bacterium]